MPSVLQLPSLWCSTCSLRLVAHDGLHHTSKAKRLRRTVRRRSIWFVPVLLVAGCHTSSNYVNLAGKACGLRHIKHRTWFGSACHPDSQEGTTINTDLSRDEAFMERLQGLALEALTWPFLVDRQRLIWASALEFDAVPVEELPPWFLEQQNLSRRSLGVHLLSMDGKRALLCSSGVDGHVPDTELKRFLRTARCVCKASDYILVTCGSCQLTEESERWLRRYGAVKKPLTKQALWRYAREQRRDINLEHSADLPLRPCQEACLNACAKGARVVELACGTGKTRIMRELANDASECDRVLVTTPSRVLMEQISKEFPTFCKVGMGYNRGVNFSAPGFVSVTDSVHRLQKIKFGRVLIDEAHHPIPRGMPEGRELYKFSATHVEDVDYRYAMSRAIQDGVLCDYDMTLPVTTKGHPFLSLAHLLVSMAGHFRRVLAYCNSVAEAKRFRSLLESLGLAAWHMNGFTRLREREKIMEEFTGCMQKPVHILVTVQVLGEGVNIPNADTCMFVEPRNSYKSIVQAMGRVLRHHPSKPLAHIVLPAIAADPRSSQPEVLEADRLRVVAREKASTVPHAGEKGVLQAGHGKLASGNTDMASIRSAADTASSRAVANQSSVRGPVRPKATQAWTHKGRRKENFPTKVHPDKSSSEVLVEGTSVSIDNVTYEYRPARQSREVQAYTRRTGNEAMSGHEGLRALVPGGFHEQVERFMLVIAQADSRLQQQPLQSRLRVVDARSETLTAGIITKDIFHKVTFVLKASRTDAWADRFQALEKFVREKARLPTERAKDDYERNLGIWLRTLGISVRQRTAPTYRVQRMLGSPWPLIRNRVQEWLGYDLVFTERCDRLKEFVRKHGKIPTRREFMGNKASTGYQLVTFLANVRAGAFRITETRLQMLREVHPLVAEKLASWIGSKRGLQERAWHQRAQRVIDFVTRHARIPKPKVRQEFADYWWLTTQKYRFALLPEEWKRKLLHYPVLASYLLS
ncbi:irc3 [Symbiodinium sp. CCMP2456]|nr:irc3 [Symbiodinium sp. CCMP2456]